MEQAFSQFGSVSSAKVMMERDTGRSKGFGFVEMGSDAEAQAAIRRHEWPTTRWSWSGRERSPSYGSHVLPVAAASAAAAVVAAATAVAAAVVTAVRRWRWLRGGRY
jgi:hypothetical protein